MHPDVKEILFTSAEIARRVKSLAAEIDAVYQGKSPLLVSILKGGFVFMADLIRHMSCDLRVEFMAVSSYGNRTESTGSVRVLHDLATNIEGLDVLIIEDILDSGISMRYIMELLSGRKPASLRLCTLFDKPDRRVQPVQADFCGFRIPDAFVIGYGLDYAEKYRNLPYLGVIKPECV